MPTSTCCVGTTWKEKKWQEENGGDANEVWLWHVTSSNGAEKSIVENGFDLNRCGLDFEYYGAGTYLAPDCKLSNRYAAKSETRSMLLVRIACGKIFERPPLHLSLEYQSFVQQLASQQLAPGHIKKLQLEKTRELLRVPQHRSSRRLPLAARRRHKRKPQEQDGGCSEQELPSVSGVSYHLPRGLAGSAQQGG